MNKPKKKNCLFAFFFSTYLWIINAKLCFLTWIFSVIRFTLSIQSLWPRRETVRKVMSCQRFVPFHLFLQLVQKSWKIFLLITRKKISFVYDKGIYLYSCRVTWPVAHKQERNVTSAATFVLDKRVIMLVLTSRIIAFTN